MSKKHNTAVLIGRYQIYHNGHKFLLDQALELADKVIVIIGSSFRARNIKNPFTWQERAEMISMTLSDEEKARVIFEPVRDYYDNEPWIAAVNKSVNKHTETTNDIVLVGYKKDHSSVYLDWFPNWPLYEISSGLKIDSTILRSSYFGSFYIPAALSTFIDKVPHKVSYFLQSWSFLPEYRNLVDERGVVISNQKEYGQGPFTTVDSLVTCNGHILLGKRKNHPGKDLWALPGGFLEKHESLLDGAIRELKEETCFNLDAKSLKKYLTSTTVFSHPNRSITRNITHVYRFDLPFTTLPDINADDDLSGAEWMLYSKLYDMEEQFHDDHFYVIAKSLPQLELM